MFNDKIKKIIGQELHKYRCDRFLQLKTVAAKTGIPWYVIDNMEIGSVRNRKRRERRQKQPARNGGKAGQVRKIT